MLAGFLASACGPFGSAGETLAVELTKGYLRREAAGVRRDDFDKVLAAAPDVAPMENDRLD